MFENSKRRFAIIAVTVLAPLSGFRQAAAANFLNNSGTLGSGFTGVSLAGNVGQNTEVADFDGLGLSAQIKHGISNRFELGFHAARIKGFGRICNLGLGGGGCASKERLSFDGHVALGLLRTRDNRIQFGLWSNAGHQHYAHVMAGFSLSATPTERLLLFSALDIRASLALLRRTVPMRRSEWNSCRCPPGA